MGLSQQLDLQRELSLKMLYVQGGYHSKDLYLDARTTELEIWVCPAA